MPTDEWYEKRGFVKCVGCERWHKPESFVMCTNYRCADCAPEFEKIPQFERLDEVTDRRITRKF